MVISSSPDKVSAMVALQTVLGLEDLYDLIEIARVDAYNARVMQSREN